MLCFDGLPPACSHCQGCESGDLPLASPAM